MRNLLYFGRTFLRIIRINIPEHTCIRSLAVTEIVTREKNVVLLWFHVLHLFNMHYPYTAQVRPKADNPDKPRCGKCAM
jgi:hypothetical protein